MSGQGLPDTPTLRHSDTPVQCDLCNVICAMWSVQCDLCNVMIWSVWSVNLLTVEVPLRDDLRWSGCINKSVARKTLQGDQGHSTGSVRSLQLRWNYVGLGCLKGQVPVLHEHSLLRTCMLTGHLYSGWLIVGVSDMFQVGGVLIARGWPDWASSSCTLMQYNGLYGQGKLPQQPNPTMSITSQQQQWLGYPKNGQWYVNIMEEYRVLQAESPGFWIQDIIHDHWYSQSHTQTGEIIRDY